MWRPQLPGPAHAVHHITELKVLQKSAGWRVECAEVLFLHACGASRGPHQKACWVQRAKRKLAPFLRVLLPSWWLACSDTHSDTASAAHAGMQAAFPGPKQREAILFCRTEVGVITPCAGVDQVLPMHGNADAAVYCDSGCSICMNMHT